MDRGVTRRQFARGVGTATAVAATASSASAQEGEDGDDGGRPDFGGYIDGAKGGSFEDLRGQSEVTVEVGAGEQGLAFSPTGVWIDAGTTIVFEWVSSGHNVLVESAPEESSWEGVEALEGDGFTHDHTFEAGGIYTYFCQPHEDLGMLGAIAVGDDVPTAGGDEAGGRPIVIGDSVKTLVVATMAAFGTTLSLAYVFLKYGGGDPPTGPNPES